MMQSLALLVAATMLQAAPAGQPGGPAAVSAREDPTLGATLFGPLLQQYGRLEPSSPQMAEPAAQRRLLSDMLYHLERADAALLGAVIQERDRPQLQSMLRQVEQGKAVPPEVLARMLKELDLHEQVAMDRLSWLYRNQIQKTFRHDWDEFYRRSGVWDKILSEWESAGSRAEQRYRLTSWLLAAMRASLPDRMAPLPEAPRFLAEATSPAQPAKPAGAATDVVQQPMPKRQQPHPAAAQAVEKSPPPLQAATQQPLLFPEEVVEGPPSPERFEKQPGMPAVETAPPTFPAETSGHAIHAAVEEVARQDRPPGMVAVPSAGRVAPEGYAAIPPTLPLARREASTSPRLDGTAAAPVARVPRLASKLPPTPVSSALPSSPSPLPVPVAPPVSKPARTADSPPVGSGVAAASGQRPRPQASLLGGLERLSSISADVSAAPHPAPASKNAAARINLTELTARIIGNNIDLEALAAELDQGGTWTADRIAPLVSRLQLLAGRGKDLSAVYQLLEEDERRLVAPPRPIQDLIPRLGTRIFEARSRAQGSEFPGTLADRDAELKILDQLSEVLVDLAK